MHKDVFRHKDLTDSKERPVESLRMKIGQIRGRRARETLRSLQARDRIAKTYTLDPRDPSSPNRDLELMVSESELISRDF